MFFNILVRLFASNGIIYCHVMNILASMDNTQKVHFVYKTITSF